MTWWKFWRKNNDSYLLEIRKRMALEDEVRAEIYSSMKENDLKKLARSNYLLRELRRLLNLNTECSAWFDFNSFGSLVLNLLDKADRSKRFYFNEGKFNGATLCSANNPFLSTTIYFLDDKSFLPDSENDLRKYYGLLDKVIAIEAGNIPILFLIPGLLSDATKEMDWQALLNEANNEFERQLECEGEQILSQVSRFFVEMHFYEKKSEEAKKKFTDICAEFSNPTIIYPFQKGFAAALCDSGEIPCEQKAEVVLDRPISKDEFISRMRRSVSQITEPIFGYGFQYKFQGDISIHLYARQF